LPIGFVIGGFDRNEDPRVAEWFEIDDRAVPSDAVNFVPVHGQDGSGYKKVRSATKTGAEELATENHVEPEELLKAVIDLSDDAIFTVTTGGEIASWCATAERIFGFRADEVLGTDIASVFPEHFRQTVREVLERAISGEHVRHFESEVIRSDGMPVPVWLSLCSLLDENKAPIAVEILARDVTEQKLAQAALAEVEARLEEGEALAHVGSWLWDLRTGAVQWSAEFHRLHAVGPADFDGTFDSYIELVHPDDKDRVVAAMRSSVEFRRPIEMEYRVVVPDTGIRRIHVRAHPTIGSSGKAIGLRGVGKDATES
jgi:PAS domain S-box-containing protein